MASYAVLWKEQADDALQLGRLEFDAHGFALHGNTRDARLFIADGDLDEIERDSTTRLGPCQALRLSTRDGITLLVAALSGLGVLTEIQQEIATRITAAV
jgi:hypothetical protein